MKKVFFICLALLFSYQAFSTEKHALIIAIGDYPRKTGWGKISSKSDVELISGTLVKQGFSEKNITTLLDAQATKKGITDAMNSLQSRVKEGDIVVIHYSGHGQQIFDDNGDEADGLDEALVPYDAFVKHSYAYTGENHIRDDELGNILTEFRNKLGKNGEVLFILDSCHSGSMTRGGIARGGQKYFAPEGWTPPMEVNTFNEGASLFDRTAVREDAAPFVMISGASADELNFEYNGVGSLSYAFSKAMNELGTDFSYRQLFASIAANMNVISPKQTPTIEGDLDKKLFKGEYIQQHPYFDVTRLALSNSIIHINGGIVNHIFENTTVLVVPAGTVSPENATVLAKGTVTASKFGEAIISLDKALKDNNPKNYIVFIDQPSYGDIAVNVYLDASVTDQEIIKGVTAFLEKNNLGDVVKDSLFADVFLYREGENYALGHAKGLEEFSKTNASRGAAAVDEITEKIFSYAQGNYLKALNIKNKSYEFDFKLLPVEYNPRTNRVLGMKPEEAYISEFGIFQVSPSVDHVVLQVTNKGEKDIFVSIVEINSAGEVSAFFPNTKCKLTNDERKIAPGQTVVFRECVYSFGPPFERLILKGFASDKPLNFQSTAATRGQTTAGNNPLEKFLQQSYTQTRGSEAESVSGDLDGYSTEFVYDIVRK